MTLTEQVLNKIKELAVTDEAISPNAIAEEVANLIAPDGVEGSGTEHDKANAIYDAVEKLMSLLVADVGQYQ